ncbi:hypothetical protein [Lysobacter sp. CA199]|uniref:hypothetical protein n=1 Tax=Lysobacter sp. CA199 TaxID=3455608 RepID=UPI003F8D1292
MKAQTAMRRFAEAVHTNEVWLPAYALPSAGAMAKLFIVSSFRAAAPRAPHAALIG